MRVVVDEDEALMREGLVLVLERAGFEVVGEAGDATEPLRQARAHDPDLVVTDIRMPPALELRRERPELAVLVLSQHVQRRYALELFELGTHGVGYLLKQRIADVETFVQSLERVSSGGSALDPEVVAVMVSRTQQDDEALDGLTPRQREVLALVAEGRSNAAIARRLSITEKAVVRHVAHVYDALGLTASPDDHRRVRAVVEYLSRTSEPPQL